MDTTDTSPPNISISPIEFQSLKTLLDGELQQYRALVELSNLSQTQNASAKTTEPLVSKLNVYPLSGVVDLENLVVYPPKLEPVPVKPLFFDAAWNYIEYPGREVEKQEKNVKAAGAVAEKGAEQTAQQKKGWFGFGR